MVVVAGGERLEGRLCRSCLAVSHNFKRILHSVCGLLEAFLSIVSSS